MVVETFPRVQRSEVIASEGLGADVMGIDIGDAMTVGAGDVVVDCIVVKVFAAGLIAGSRIVASVGGSDDASAVAKAGTGSRIVDCDDNLL